MIMNSGSLDLKCRAKTTVTEVRVILIKLLEMMIRRDYLIVGSLDQKIYNRLFVPT